MNRLVPILITLGVIIIGAIRKIQRCYSLNKRRLFTFSFRNNFIEMANDFLNSGRISNELYSKCICDVNAIQIELGEDGLIADYVDRLHGVKGRDYQLFMNIFSELRSVQGMTFNTILMERAFQLLGLCEDALQRHIGSLERSLNDEKRGLINPFTSFGEGIRFIIGLPIDILLWCGIINSKRNGKVKNSIVFKILNVIVIIIGLIGSIITILLGWNQVSDYIHNSLGWF